VEEDEVVRERKSKVVASSGIQLQPSGVLRHEDEEYV